MRKIIFSFTKHKLKFLPKNKLSVFIEKREVDAVFELVSIVGSLYFVELIESTFVSL